MKIIGSAEKGNFGVLVGAPVRSISAEGAPGVPEQIQILPYPVWETDEGSLVTDNESQRLCLNHFRQRRTRLVIDYEHQTLKDIEAPAAGWIHELIAGGEAGLIGRVEWTERGAAYVAGREYDYHSPVAFYDRETRRVLALHSVALTNTPKTQNQKPLSEQIAAKALADFEQQTTKEEGMKKFIAKLKSVFSGGLEKITCKGLRAALTEALAEVPDTDELITAKAGEGFAGEIAAMLAPLGFVVASAKTAAVLASKEVLELLGLQESATLPQIQAKVLELKTPANMVAKADYDKVVADLAAMKKDSETQSIDTLITANRAKITPAREPFVREIFAKYGLEHTKQVVASWKDELPAAPAKGPEEKPAPEIVTKRKVGGKELPVSEGSATLAAKIRTYQKEKGIATYTEASEKYQREQPAV